MKLWQHYRVHTVNEGVHIFVIRCDSVPAMAVMMLYRIGTPEQSALQRVACPPTFLWRVDCSGVPNRWTV